MKKKKIVLAALNAKYVHANLAVHVLGEYARLHAGESSTEIAVREYTINQNLDAILGALYREEADVLACSCYIWNIREVLTLTKDIKKVQPETEIWLGGPEVSYCCEQILAEHTEIAGVMIGEGEQTFCELVQHIGADDHAYEEIAGICFRTKEGSLLTTAARGCIPMDAVPFVYHDMEKFANRILYYETSRGCPFSCSYCLSSIDKQVRFRSLTLVFSELQFFLDHKVRQVKLIDRTFNCSRAHADAIWQYIMEHDNGVTNFHFEISADLLTEEELALFQKMRPGLIQLEIGLQSTNAETITEIRRRMNVPRLKKNMLQIHAMGNIHQHLDLIAGLPHEDLASFRRSFDDAYAMKPHQLQLGFLKVLKGSFMEEQQNAYGLLCQDTPPYEVLKTNWLSYADVLKLKQIEEMLEVYHNSAQFVHSLAYLMQFYDSAYDCFAALGDYYEKHAWTGTMVKREMRYEALLAFADAVLQSKEAYQKPVFTALLTYDYYLRENAKARPAFCGPMSVEKEVYQNFYRNAGTEEYSFAAEHYDSHAAARSTHLEMLPAAAASRIYGKNIGQETVRYCLFEYDKRNPLTGDAFVTMLTHL